MPNNQTSFPCFDPATGACIGTTLGARLGVYSLTEYATAAQLSVDAQPAFDKALLAAKTPNQPGGIWGGTILFPSGAFVLDQMRLFPGIHIAGTGTNSTVVTQREGSNKSFIINDPSLGTVSFLHHSGVSDMFLKKKQGTTDTVGSGIELNCRFGELCHFSRLLFTDWPQSGIRANRGGQPVKIRDIHAFRCGEYGIDLRRTGGDIWQTVVLDMISGDNHKKGLIHIQGGGVGLETFRLVDIKVESFTAGTMPCAIEFDGMNSARVQIENVGVYVIQPMPTIIKVTTSKVRILGGIIGASGVSGASVEGLTALIDDVPAARQIPYDNALLSFKYDSDIGLW